MSKEDVVVQVIEETAIKIKYHVVELEDAGADFYGIDEWNTLFGCYVPTYACSPRTEYKWITVDEILTEALASWDDRPKGRKSIAFPQELLDYEFNEDGRDIIEWKLSNHFSKYLRERGFKREGTYIKQILVSKKQETKRQATAFRKAKQAFVHAAFGYINIHYEFGERFAIHCHSYQNVQDGTARLIKQLKCFDGIYAYAKANGGGTWRHAGHWDENALDVDDKKLWKELKKWVRDIDKQPENDV